MEDIKNLAEQYINDESNREDLNFFHLDKDEFLFKRVVCAWGQVNGLDKSNAHLLSDYVVDLSNGKYGY